jgi:4-hydroxythreonine-4-phosphate dehydrogenase
LPVIAITPGEPAGIGPDIAIALLGERIDASLAVVADPRLLAERARQLCVPLRIEPFDGTMHEPGVARVIEVPLAAPVTPGRLDPANARYVLAALDAAVGGCLSGRFDALVTGPVHKGVINDAGMAFSGHTEYLAARTGAALPVMMLVAAGLRVALATTHLPLARVPSAITGERLEQTLRVLHGDLRRRFGIDDPRISVCGLNPHAGESGHLGREEIEVIGPVLGRLRDEGMRLAGPLPADTAFTPTSLRDADAVLAMYHDQGLPVIKHAAFGEVVNITLGLPIIRTSVDHGTALDLTATGRAGAGSLRHAVGAAIALAAAAAAASPLPG